VTAKRIGAALVAVALIVIALVVRRTVIDDDDAAAGPSTAPTTAAPTAATELVCATELAAACQAVKADHPGLTVRVEPAGTTLDRLAASKDPAPLWATIEPFPEMVDVLRPQDPVGYTTEPLASSQLILALPHGGRSAALGAACTTPAVWACIGNVAGTAWSEYGGDPSFGRIRPSLGRVDREAVALASFANAVAGYTDSPTINAGALGDDLEFRTWLRRLAGADTSGLSGGTPLATMVTRAGSLDIAATTVADVAVLFLSRDDLQLDTVTPNPTMWVQAVLAVPPGTAAPDGLAADLTTELSLAGWRAPEDATQPVPDATTMVALRELWKSAT
jgi:hypothetical protein